MECFKTLFAVKQGAREDGRKGVMVAGCASKKGASKDEEDEDDEEEEDEAEAVEKETELNCARPGER